MVFRLGNQGFDAIQTFSWQTEDFGLDLSDFGLVGIRSQQLCKPGELLPYGDCEDSDKSYGYANTVIEVSEPGSQFALIMMGLIRLRLVRKR